MIIYAIFFKQKDLIIVLNDFFSHCAIEDVRYWLFFLIFNINEKAALIAYLFTWNQCYLFKLIANSIFKLSFIILTCYLKNHFFLFN